MDLRADRETFAEQGYIGPFTLWEPEEMTAWWKANRRELLNPENDTRKAFDNPVNYDRHLDIPGLSRLITEPEIVRDRKSVV